MKRASVPGVFGLALATGLLCGTGALGVTEPTINFQAEGNKYSLQNSVELGGAAGLSWSSSQFSFTLSPNVGWFVIDRFELSAIFGLTYTNLSTAAGRVGHTVTSLLIEPSYHIPFGKQILGFAGLGLGTGYDGTQWVFNFVPRAGLNILLGQNAVFTPAVLLPIGIGGSSSATFQVQGAFSVVF
jgi:hypothetical protein